MARTQLGPSGRRPPLCTAPVASPRSPPELARCPRPRRRTPAEAPVRRTSPERGGLTGHAPEPGPAPWEPSACTRRAGGSPSRGAALRRPLSPMRWPACAGPEPGWPPSPPTVRLAGGRAGRRGVGAEPVPRETSGFGYGLWGLPGREPNPWAQGPTSASPGGCLGARRRVPASRIRRPQKAHIWEPRESRKIPVSGVLTRDAGCEVLLRV